MEMTLDPESLVITDKASLPFDVETVRKHFEDDVRKTLVQLGFAKKKEQDEFFERAYTAPSDYCDFNIQMEWQGWKRGVLLGFELWGKKGTS